jgi:hypothetical protein
MKEDLTMSSQGQDINQFIHVEGGRHLPGDKFVRNEMMTILDVADFRKKNKNLGLYLSAYIYAKADPKEGPMYADFYLDFDDEGDFEKVRKDAIYAIWYMEQNFKYSIPKELIRIYYSGKKGVHLVVPATIFGIEPHINLNEYYKIMAKDFAEHSPYDTIDLKIYDRRRLFRMVNSQHQDTLLYKVPITYTELVTKSVEEIREIASQPRVLNYPKAYPIAKAKQEFQNHVDAWGSRFGKQFDNRKRFKEKPLDFVPHCIQELINQGPQKGKRNETGCVLAAFWRKQGCTEQEAWDLLAKWNNGSMGEGELKQILEKMYKNEYSYGCSTLESLASCIGGECPLHRSNKKQR